MIARTKFTIRVMQSHEMGGGREGKSSVLDFGGRDQSGSW